MKILSEIQQKLSVPKNQFNDFGKYSYRSCEDILEAVKPLLGKATLLLTDEVVVVGKYNYVKATAILRDNEGDLVEVNAYAREPEEKKGMDVSQMTGTASSYARKYALNGLFAIDDTKDADTMDNTKEKKETKGKMLSYPVNGPDPTWEVVNGKDAPKCEKCGTPKLWSANKNKWYCKPCVQNYINSKELNVN